MLLTIAKRSREAERRHLSTILNNGGVATAGEVKIQHDVACSICLRAADKKCRCCYTLDCGHCFHSYCLLKWYNKATVIIRNLSYLGLT